MKSNIDEASIVISDATVKFGLKSGEFYEIYDDSAMPFNGSGVTVEVSANHGYKFFNPTVKFPLKPFNQECANIVSALAKGSELVVILEQEEKGTDDTSRYVVFGLQGGLYCTTPMFEMANDSVWEIELVEHRADMPALFLYDTDLAGTTLLASMLLNYEWIQSFQDEEGVVHVETITGDNPIFIDADKSVIVGVNKTIYTTAIATGTCFILISKLSSDFSIQESNFIGEITVVSDSILEVDFGRCQDITHLNAPKAPYIFGDDSGLLAEGVKLIFDNAYSLYLNGEYAGTIELFNVTAISGDDISSVHGLSYSTIKEQLELEGWNITYTFSGS
jgi:hypothetical protein